MDDTVGPVRDAAAEAFGTLLKVVGEKPLAVFMDQLDKIKQDKVSVQWHRLHRDLTSLPLTSVGENRDKIPPRLRFS